MRALCLFGVFSVATIGVPAMAAEVAVESSVPPVKNAAAEATTATEMKPYSEAIRHTEAVVEMVPIPGGKFLMGSPATEASRGEDEGPQHTVEIAPFWMGKYEVTWDEYEVWTEQMDQLRRKLMAIKASERDLLVDGVTRPTEPYTDMSFGMGKGRHPAICMTQHSARMFCKWLSTKTGRYYRLPTEAEWEYACRAGTTTAYSFGDDPADLEAHAWLLSNTDDAYEEVGQKKPNPWGLYDMHGNVSEWVLDQYSDQTYAKRGNAVIANPLQVPTTLYPRVVRGGGWDDDPEYLRSAARKFSEEEWKDQDPQLPRSIWYHTDALSVGFRVVRPLVEPSAEEKARFWDKCEPVQLDPVDGE